MTIAAPARSIGRSSPFDSGTTAAIINPAITSSGTLSAKNHRQPNASTTSPPTTGAAAAAVLPIALHMPIAHARRSGPALVETTDNDAGMNNDVATPCTTRPTTRTSNVHAAAHSSVPAANSTTPANSSRRRP